MDLLPFFAAAMIMPIPHNQEVFGQILQRYILALLLFVSWRSFRILFQQSKSLKAPFVNYLSLFVLGCMTALCLQVLRAKMPLTWFYALMLTLFALFLIDFYERRGRVWLAAGVEIIYLYFLALTGFVLSQLDINLTVSVFCAAVSLLSFAIYLVYMASRGSVSFAGLKEPFKKRLVTIAYALCLILPAVIIIGIATQKKLPFQYNLVCLVLPFAAILINKAGAVDSQSDSVKKLLTGTAAYALTFGGLLTVLRQFTL